MKTKFSKILSSLLILSFLISMFSVFAFTASAEDESEEEESEYTLFVNRSFDEGWGPTNGFSSDFRRNGVYVDYEEGITNDYNYFTRFEVLNENYARLSFPFKADAVPPGVEPVNTIIEFSIKADDVAKLGNILYMETQLNTETVNLVRLDENENIILLPGKGDYNLGKINNKWLNIAFCFDFTKTGSISGTFHYGTGDGYQNKIDFDFNLTKQGGGVKSFTFGFPNNANRAIKNDLAQTKGMTFCLDNVKIYTGTPELQNIAKEDYGSKVDRNAQKTVDIQKNANDKSKAQIIDESLAMKVGVDYALVRNVKYPLVNNQNQQSYKGVYGAPWVDAEGNVLVPIELVLDYIGFPYYLHADKKSFDITTGSNVTNITVDRDTAVVDGVRIELAAAPCYKIEGERSYIGLALADIPKLFPGWLSIYDNMGFILVYEDKTPENTEDNEPILTREYDLQKMVDVMKRFVFDKVEVDGVENSYLANGEKVYNDAKTKTSSFSHPYIMANSDTFAKLKAAYALTSGQTGYDERLNAYIKTVLAEAESYYSANAQVSGTSYAGIKSDKIPVNPYYDGKSAIKDTIDGYDADNGRLDIIEEYTAILPVIAFAYQITGNENYAKFAYDWSEALAAWTHWGPGYFENCANATASFAISYDWLYNAYKALGKDTDKLAYAIYELGVHDGYLSSAGELCQHPRSLGDLSVYNNAANEKNAIGAYGMITGALAILDYVDADEAMLYEAVYLIGNNMDMLATYGLDIYAPDGSYVETAKQWELGTASFFRMVMALTGATGSHYGFMDTWGVDKTCYFGIYIESSDGFAWNYNDANGDGVSSSGTLESLNTDMFNFVGSFYGDDALLATRHKQIAAGKAVTIFDLIAYPVGKTVEDKELALDYQMEGVEGYVSRSGWEKGDMYVGLMGGENSGNKAQLDSGNFVYHNKGIVWIMDLGGENPANNNYVKESTRYKYYRANAEGQNVVYIVNNEDLPYGQNTTGGGKIVNTFENEHGSYAILDNTGAYSASYVSRAFRGLLVTNDRKTVVLQDEVSFVNAQSVFWVVHTAHSIYIDPTTSRTAYITATAADGRAYTLRASIITPSTDLKFTTLKSELIDKTLPATADGSPSYKRDKINRLAISIGGEGTFSGVGSFNVSVVFEMVEGRNDKTPVGYEWAMMNTWEPKVYDTEIKDDENTTNKRAPAAANHIKTETPKLVTALKKNNAFKERVKSIYDMITLIEYTLKKFPAENLDSSYASFYGDYLDCYDKYEKFYDYVNDSVEIVDNISAKLTGIVPEVVEESETE